MNLALYLNIPTRDRSVRKYYEFSTLFKYNSRDRSEGKYDEFGTLFKCNSPAEAPVTMMVFPSSRVLGAILVVAR